MDTSPFAYEHVLRKARRLSASRRNSGEPMEGSPQYMARVYAPLFWLYRLFLRFTVGEGSTSRDVPAPDFKNPDFVSKYSRSTRRMIAQNRLFLDMRKIKNQLYIDRLFFKGLSPTQRREKHARISGLGRIAVFGMRYWGTRLQRRARLKMLRSRMVAYATNVCDGRGSMGCAIAPELVSGICGAKSTKLRSR